MKPVSRRTLDWIYSVVGFRPGGAPQDGPFAVPRRGGPLCLQPPETPEPIPEFSVSLPPRLLLFRRTRSSASDQAQPSVLVAGTSFILFGRGIPTLATS